MKQQEVLMAHRYLTIAFSLVVAFVASGLAQDKAQIDRWRGLVLNETTPGQAIEILGEPKSDMSGKKYRPLKFNEWFDVEKKDFRVFHYEGKQGIEGFDDVKLYFRNGLLLAIRLEPEELKAHQLSLAYDSEFVYVSDKFFESVDPGDFERNRGQSFPKSYPTQYYLMNKNDDAYAFAFIANNSFGSILGKSLGVKDASESIPGNVKVVELISMALQSTKGVNILK